MAEYERRRNDTWYGMLTSMWPVILTLVTVAYYLIRGDYRLAQTSALADKTAERVSVLEQAVAVQTQILSDIRDAVKDIQRRGQ
jgi:hypothetical protein